MRRIRILGAAIALALPLIGGQSVLATPAYAVTCQPGTPTPTDSYPGAVVMANNFESGTLNGFVVNTSGDGTASVSSAQAHDGACSAYLHATTNSTSLANFSTILPSGAQQVYADAWFDIAQAGVTGWDVPYFRFFNGSTRYVDVYRSNDDGTLWVRVLSATGSYESTSLGRTIPLNTWHQLSMHVIPNGSATTVEVWVDGAEVYSSNQVNIAASSLTSVMNGAEHYTQMEDTYIDSLIVKAATTPPAAPMASFTATPTSGTAPLNVAFADTSTGSPTSWSWTFGDGSTSTEQNPIHTYATAGTYTAKLTATNSGGSSTASSTITVSPAPPPAPVASFTATPTSGTAPLSVAFADTSTGSPTSWSWAFGDGGTSTAQNPIHTYSTAGTYMVSLTATNAAGTSTASTTITVSPAAPQFTSMPSQITSDTVGALPLTGTSDPGATVALTAADSANHSVAATAIANGSGSWSATMTLSPLNSGAVTFTAQATDVNGSMSTVTTATSHIGPRVVSVTLVNGGTPGTVDTNDKVVVVFNEPMSPSSFCSGWTSATGPWTKSSNSVSVLISRNTSGPGDTLTIPTTGCTASNFGTVNLGAHYTTSTGGNLTFKGTGIHAPSSVSLSADRTTLTITLGALKSGTPATGVTPGTPTYQGGANGQTGIATDTSAIPLGTKPSAPGTTSGF